MNLLFTDNMLTGAQATVNTHILKLHPPHTFLGPQEESCVDATVIIEVGTKSPRNSSWSRSSRQWLFSCFLFQNLPAPPLSPFQMCEQLMVLVYIVRVGETICFSLCYF